VSNQIRHLEGELGVALLERIGKSARATPEGEILIAAASRCFADIEAAMDEITRMQAEISGTLIVATGATATRHLLPPVIADLYARHPGIDLRVLTGNTADMLPGLLDGSIDIGLLTAPIDSPSLHSKFFFRDRLVCIAPPAELTGSGPLRPGQFEGRKLVLYDRGGSIRRAVDGWLGDIDRPRLRITDIGSADAQAAFVRAGLGWSIISEIAALDDAAAGRIDLAPLDPPLHRDLVLVWRADRAERPTIAAALAVFATHVAAAAL
jgi:DNA-binding transcriptional LysR family regulator